MSQAVSFDHLYHLSLPPWPIPIDENIKHCLNSEKLFDHQNQQDDQNSYDSYDSQDVENALYDENAYDAEDEEENSYENSDENSYDDDYNKRFDLPNFNKFDPFGLFSNLNHPQFQIYIENNIQSKHQDIQDIQDIGDFVDVQSHQDVEEVQKVQDVGHFVDVQSHQALQTVQDQDQDVENSEDSDYMDESVKPKKSIKSIKSRNFKRFKDNDEEVKKKTGYSKEQLGKMKLMEIRQKFDRKTSIYSYILEVRRRVLNCGYAIKSRKEKQK